jgi:hypothetical protein
MRLLGSGVEGITGVSGSYTLELPNASGLIAMSSTSLPCPENWMQNQYVTVATYTLNPGQTYHNGSFSIQPDLDGDHSDVADPTMSVQTAGLFNIPLDIENTVFLPVELLFFEAALQGDEVVLHWETASEVNNEGFEILRSENGIHFSRIGWQPGAGTTQTRQGYTFVDTDPNSGDSYYRLRQLDHDGQFEFSDIVHIHTADTGGKIRFYPNPTRDFIYYSGIELQTVDIFGIDGKFLGSQQPAGDQRIDLRELSGGVYFLNINKKYTIKVVKGEE